MVPTTLHARPLSDCFSVEVPVTVNFGSAATVIAPFVRSIKRFRRELMGRFFTQPHCRPPSSEVLRPNLVHYKSSGSLRHSSAKTQSLPSRVRYQSTHPLQLVPVTALDAPKSPVNSIDYLSDSKGTVGYHAHVILARVSETTLGTVVWE